MFKYKNKPEANNSIYNKIINELSVKYDYIERNVDGKIVLEHSRVKFVEIKDTPNDRRTYVKAMTNYINIIKERYYKDAMCKNADLNKIFDLEVLTKGGLPLFFVYNCQNELLGICGFDRFINLNIDGKNIPFNELSIRLMRLNGVYSYGVICYFVLSLFAVRKDKRYFFRSFQLLRDLIFRSVDQLTYIRYIKSCKCKVFFLDVDYSYDVFLDYTSRDKSRFIFPKDF